MAETIRPGCSPPGAHKWHWHNVHADLVRQGGIREEELSIDPLSVRDSFLGGKFRGMPFSITWAKDQFLLLSYPDYSPELTDAFAKVVEYRPFAKYVEHGGRMITVEWDKVNPEKRYEQLRGQGKSCLTRIV